MGVTPEKRWRNPEETSRIANQSILHAKDKKNKFFTIFLRISEHYQIFYLDLPEVYAS